MKLLVLGAGGIGGLFGGRLAQTGADVTFLVREKRKADLARAGLRIESQFGNASLPVQVKVQSEIEPGIRPGAAHVQGVRPGPGAIETIRPAMAGTTAVLPLLNGLPTSSG